MRITCGLTFRFHDRSPNYVKITASTGLIFRCCECTVLTETPYDGKYNGPFCRAFVVRSTLDLVFSYSCNSVMVLAIFTLIFVVVVVAAAYLCVFCSEQVNSPFVTHDQNMLNTIFGGRLTVYGPSPFSPISLQNKLANRKRAFCISFVY